MDFVIRKDIYGSWWHDFNNGSTKVNISDFNCVIDEVANTFVIQCFNGSNVPSKPISITDVKVIDQSIDNNPIPFSGAVGLKNLLTTKQYPPFRLSSITYDQKVVWRKGQAVLWNETQEYFDDNFDGTGLGIALADGWALCNGNNGTKNFKDKFILNKGETYPTLYTNGGSANSVLIAHKHDSIEFADGQKSVNDSGVGSTILGKIASFVSGSQKVNRTSTKGIANNGADAPSEDGLGKNMPPYIVAQWVERTEDLIVYYTGSEGGSTPNLTQVLQQQDRVYKQLTDNPYSFVSEDGVKWILNPDVDELIFDDSDNEFLLYSEIRLINQIDCTINFIDTDVRSNLGVDAETPITSAILLKGDDVSFKKIGSDPIWFMQVNRIGSGGGAVDSVNGQTGVVVLDAADVGAEPTKGADDNYVTDAQLIVIGNTSGTNTGDQDLSNLVVKNTAITGATKTKITYDAKGLVTSGADATTADIADSSNKRYQTDAQQTNNDATSSIQTQLNARKRPIVRDTTSVTVTGTTALTLVKTFEITAGTLPTSGILDLFMYSNRTGTNAIHTMGLYINTTNNFATATLIGTATTGGNFTPVLSFKGSYTLKNNLLLGGLYSNVSGTNYAPSATQTSVSCNNTSASVWFFVGVTPSNSGQTIDFQAIEIVI